VDLLTLRNDDFGCLALGYSRAQSRRDDMMSCLLTF
jgi:hypothetical protein